MAITAFIPTVSFDGTEVANDEIHAVTIELDLDNPDMAAIQLSNKSTPWSATVKLGAEVVIESPSASEGPQGSSAKLFVGEVLGVEPLFAAGEPARVVVRAMSYLHKLSRQRKSRTFVKQKDSEIASTLSSDNQLQGQVDDTSAKHEHIFQHNQTDLEFIRLRAARNGYNVWVEEKKLFFKKRVTAESGVELKGGIGAENLERFTPKLSLASQAKKVQVRGWDYQKKEKILGEATSIPSLGSKTGVSEAKDTAVYVAADVPVFSKEVADKIAMSILEERSMGFITAEGQCKGEPKLKPALQVKIDVGCDRFNGKYYLTAVRHSFSPTAGFRTEFRVRRNAGDK
jgi:uncharacterized protein